MNDSQKVSILMAEYNTLRAEVLAARSYLAQAIGITSAVMIGVIGFSSSPNFLGPQWTPWALAAIAFTYLGGTFISCEISTRRFTKRLREIEADVNKRAGERLLVWETQSGWGSFSVPLDLNNKK